MPKSTSSYAQEGTLAHEIASALVDVYLGVITEQQYALIERECRNNTLWDDSILEHGYTYRDYILYKVLNGDELIHMTELTDLSLEPFVPEGKGTADFVSFDGKTLHVVDYKYGKGVKVDALDNEQLKLYALGTVLRFKISGPKTVVMMHIVQPRITEEPEATWLYLHELMDWAEKEVKPKAIAAMAGTGDYCPSSSTCKFCRAKAVCKGLADDIFASVGDMLPASTLELHEVAKNLERGKLIEAWVKAMDEHIFNALMSGKAVPGWKLVAGRSSRKIENEEIAAQRLSAAGFEQAKTHKLTLLGLTDLEKVVGKKKLPEVLGDTLVKPTGRPTLTDMSDPRQEIAPEALISGMFEGVTIA